MNTHPSTPDHLIRKYNIAGPRYTSYPAVPSWKEDSLDESKWKEKVKSTFDATNTVNGISLYIHLPFCESLCTYCGCNTRITINHSVELPYIQSLLKEWQLYLEVFQEIPHISEIHLGGGTPTFFSPENLQLLIEGIKKSAWVKAEASLSFEAHPNNTTEHHLRVLYDLGFRRMSLGIQDFDLAVQKIVHRIQTYETVHHVVSKAREIGYTSINFDLIYGLPLQSVRTIRDTFQKVAKLRPDRIAYYSYAHVPWVKPGQRSFTESDLPQEAEKRALYELGKSMLADLDYHEIGMDHFALKTDELYVAANNHRLHRNFMGYTTLKSDLVIGLGASSIGDTGAAYGQNVKKVETYKDLVTQGKLPVYRGHFLSKDEQVIRKHISNLMCQFETTVDQKEDQMLLDFVIDKLSELCKDDLVTVDKNQVKVMPVGRAFVRNICMAFDKPYWSTTVNTRSFSKTI
ncbi:oxygen-independent coproporphyrinogen III oxidase [Reichenbachiella agarivorans]|uniref:Coproporphyrinogen-III oxidase n=1 Tax=Reichenbachiella agarivorans TaxID=2979464 RepID=A0ABY6CLN6_9BACT|nr:oxygen-independent coproporphyrinogen III oxidase [Reichenbachiella agarivorans]UXP31428.1 oxygen-independent coproporphyrinogen III oxidase [Reichenbachiella agarivorans]